MTRGDAKCDTEGPCGIGLPGRGGPGPGWWPRGSEHRPAAAWIHPNVVISFSWEHAEQIGLHTQRDVADLVQENRAACAVSNTPTVVCERAGERARLWPKS